LEEEKPDFIFLDRYVVQKFNISSIIRMRKYRFVMEESEFEDFDRPNSRWKMIQYNKRMKRFYSVLPCTSLFILMTNTLCRHYEELTNHKGRIIHIPMTVDLSRFDRSNVKTGMLPDLPSPYIAYCGSLSNRKDGIDVLIRSFAEFHKQFPQYHLCLAGRIHPDTNEQKQLIESFGVQNHVHYIGVLDQAAIPAYLCNAAILALARPKSHQAEGGFPTKLGEYLATGNPVCVTKTGEIADYLRDGESAFLAEPDSVKSFTNALCRVASDISAAKEIGRKGRLVAEESFNMDVHIKRLMKELLSF
jgi:glycosyltransferase involved in cell wall biosynthesis